MLRLEVIAAHTKAGIHPDVRVVDAHCSYATAEAEANRMRGRPWADVSWKRKKQAEFLRMNRALSTPLSSEGPVLEDSTPVFLSSAQFHYEEKQSAGSSRVDLRLLTAFTFIARAPLLLTSGLQATGGSRRPLNPVELCSSQASRWSSNTHHCSYLKYKWVCCKVIE